MIYTISDTNSSTVPTSDLSFRKHTPGPEIELVYNYIDNRLPTLPRGHCRSIFIEPRLESGFPDVVVVQWHRATTEAWKMSRRNLKKVDVRVLHYLYTHGSTCTDDLKGLFCSPMDESLTRLHEAGLVIQTSRSWRAKSLRHIFAIRRLIAIEAKVTEWRQGLQQAMQNTWFASESYLLLPALPRNAKLIEKASALGVGIITSEHSINKSVISARKERIPSSYASWLFNEWAWRASLS